MVGAQALKSVLPDTIQDEIFRLSSRVNDVAIDYLCSELEHFGYIVSNVQNYDCSVIIDLSNEDTDINLRVDRIFKTFEIVAKCCDEIILPYIGDWEGVLNYLSKVSLLDD
jgi:hypothetical protein